MHVGAVAARVAGPIGDDPADVQVEDRAVQTSDVGVSRETEGGEEVQTEQRGAEGRDGNAPGALRRSGGHTHNIGVRWRPSEALA